MSFVGKDCIRNMLRTYMIAYIIMKLHSIIIMIIHNIIMNIVNIFIVINVLMEVISPNHLFILSSTMINIAFIFPPPPSKD